MQEIDDYSSHFGVENIPFGVGRREGRSPECVSRIGNEVIFLADIHNSLNVSELPQGIFAESTLNSFAALGRPVHRKVRESIQRLVKADGVPSSSKEHISEVHLDLPVAIGDFTDFSCSSHHNRNAGSALMGAGKGLPPGYLHMPLGYAGRSSSVQVSEVPVRRPRGQFFKHGLEGLQGKKTEVIYGPTEAMDFELEIGVIVGQPVSPGSYVSAKDASDNFFGFVLLNDWSARDVQQLEMRPVGPLNSKHAATSISPWVITPDALEQYRVPARAREQKLAPHLHEDDGKLLAATVTASIGKAGQAKPALFCKTNSSVMDWTFEALVAHQSSSGCGMRTADLLGIGTISGPGSEERGCLLEQHAEGNEFRRPYLVDGEQVTLSASCGPGVGFGECKAEVLAAVDASVWESV